MYNRTRDNTANDQLDFLTDELHELDLNLSASQEKRRILDEM